MHSMKELEVYAENTRSLMLYMNLHLLGIDNKEANLAASHLGRALGICDVIKKIPYYLAVQRGYIPAEVLLRHNLMYDRIWDKIGGEAIVVDEFYDVLLEMAAYAKKHLEASRKIASES
jgi:NADH dehydrogenase [ubiquinone] 1 alpha subcomplex assembly factor 6